MYKIRGGDGKEYGPVSTDTLRSWVGQGRANAQTFVLLEGTTEWKTLSTCPEFANLFAPPPPGMTSAVGGVPIGPSKTSGMAITSLVLGCCSIISCGFTVLLTGPLGLILGLVAMSKIKASQGRLTGWGLALAGTIVSGVSLLLIPIFAAMLLPALAKAKSKAQSISCLNNVRQLSLAVRINAGDNGDKYPAATNWCDAISVVAASPKVYVCPSAPDIRSGYAYNAQLSGLEDAKVDPGTVMFFESDAGWNASGGRELMITKPRHGGRYVIGLADGSVQQVTGAQLQNLRWDPKSQTNNP